MRIRLQWLFLMALLAMPAFAQTAAMRARIQGTVAAFNGTAEEFERYVEEAYADALKKRSTPAQRKAFLERVRGDFGAVEATTIRRDAPNRVIVGVEGTKGTRGTITIEHELEEPHKLTDVRFMLGEEEGEESSGPPLTAVPVHGRMSAGELTGALDAYIGRLAKDDRFAGSVLVARDGKPVFEKAYGPANRSDNVPNTAATRFNIGSINKHFTRVAIGQLAAAGKLALTDTISTHLPDHANPAARKATLQQLVDMTAGLADFFGPEFDAAGKQRFRSNRDYYKFIAPMALRFAPGTGKEYCNSCYITLGEIVERVSGVPYEKYVQDNVLARAGMQTAGFIALDEVAPHVAIGYVRAGGTVRANLYGRGARGNAAGGAYATARDLLLFDEALRGGRLLDPQRTAWFFGLDAPPSGRVHAFHGYAGGSQGVNAAVYGGPTWSVIVLGNVDPPLPERLAGAIYKALA